ncbi:MAG: hypothetical protein A2622_11660 [Bdellovibrionales bacterium RIFCSPHIGHO2_01_FULL_40_29]|nr:MAG: hypothetical protein A2622_11660 [Bdellovibrionales bacterium RIFCSPHIGHO2_01_FULL_40_29]OFZ35263.1 MAG: hypothetical protein A3D17_08655 [Bdellovibrionales bacterium RIFCSPHIGHO2_02_FULL_40_15]
MSILLSDRFKILKEDLSHCDFTVNQLLEKLGDKSHGLAIVILSLPFLLPIPIPGLSTIMGALISWIAVYWLLRKKIWIPQKWRHQMLPVHLFSKVFEFGERYSLKIEFLFKSRGEMILDNFFIRLMIFLLVLVSACFLALPLPPGTNFPPAITLIALALALLFEDLILLFLGMAIFIGTSIAMFIAVKFMWVQSLPFIESFLRWLF